jgi:hypothetical protein
LDIVRIASRIRDDIDERLELLAQEHYNAKFQNGV